MTEKKGLAEKHNFLNEARFRLKTFLLIARRSFKNLFSSTSRHSISTEMIHAPLLGSSESELWNPFDNDQNWILTAGKIENLRIAVKQIHGLVVPPNQVFSFWKHIGNPNLGKGYVVGREIREGCIVPTKAGGLCQLSNGLYDAALKANFNIIERHKHSKIIQGSLAEQNRDATVKWNYIDLQFSSPRGFRIEAVMTSEKLLIRLKGEKIDEEPLASQPATTQPASKLNDCYSCGNQACFKHPTGLQKKHKQSITTFILDEKWPEFETYIQSIKTPKDVFIVPWASASWPKIPRYAWNAAAANPTRATTLATMRRMMGSRWATFTGKNIFSLQLGWDKNMAALAAKKIPVESNHLVISQNLLPYLYEQGVLAGRTYDVLMVRLPLEKLHTRLNLAFSLHQQSTTLNDFRADAQLTDLENQALTQARKIISPHTELIEMFKNKAITLPWQTPSSPTETIIPTGKKILYPATTLGRKGAYEVKKLAQQFNLSLVIGAQIKEEVNFWQGVNTEPASPDIFAEVAFMLYPMYVEQQPRLILKALAKGITVITTTACGLPPTPNLVMVPPGNYQAFEQAFLEVYKNFQPRQPAVGQMMN
jgi:hypothetical protein